MLKKYLLLLGALLSGIQVAIAQVSVNQITGTPNVVIPIYKLGRGTVSMPVSLVYSGSGVKPKDVEGTAGIGWNIQAGGQISRQLRGLPDDIIRDMNGDTRTGWIYNSTGAADVVNFGIANVGFPNYTNEAADVSYINGHFSFQADTEPDILM